MRRCLFDYGALYPPLLMPAGGAWTGNVCRVMEWPSRCVSETAIVLTREGRYYADRVISCHTMVKEFLITVLKMEEKRADAVACCIEHIMTCLLYTSRCV